MAEDRKLGRTRLLVIGGSAGSLEVIIQLVPELPLRLPFAVIIVVHRKNGDSVLTELLAEKASVPVKEVEEKEDILAGTIYIAPADYHLLVEKNRTLSLDFSEKLHYSRPGIDATFETAAEAYGPELACILLSGANADGTEGLKLVKEMGGLTIVQDPTEAAVSYMPQQAVEQVAVDHVVNTKALIALVQQLAAVS
jgi:two-component system chemotaxis response regulator CheB